MAGGTAVLWDTRFVFDRVGKGLIRRKIMSIETVFYL